MYKLIEFIRSTYVVVLFVLLEAIMIGHYARSTHYARARLLAKATQVVGGSEHALAGIRRYFQLERENRELLAYAASLQERLANYEAAALSDLSVHPFVLHAADTTTVEQPDSLHPKEDGNHRRNIKHRQYRTVPATVISNTINKPENFLVLNRGSRHGVRQEMAVLSSGGAMVGYVVDCTERYAIALSVLSNSFRTSGKLSGTDYAGLIYWDGTDPHIVLMSDLSKYAEPKPGQEVETTTGSLFFPDGIKIGRIIEAHLNETGTTYTARVELTAHLSGLSHVILVENRDLDEIQNLQKSENINQYIRP